MADCDLKDFPDHILQLKQLKALVLDDNPISVIDCSKELLNNIQNLSLKNCFLQDIVGWNLHNVQCIVFRDNSIQYFPTHLGDHISVLRLNHNQLDAIPDEISLLQNITILDICNCGLKRVSIVSFETQKINTS